MVTFEQDKVQNICSKGFINIYASWVLLHCIAKNYLDPDYAAITTTLLLIKPWSTHGWGLYFSGSWSRGLRKVQVFVGDHVPPPPWTLSALLDKFVTWLNSKQAMGLHPVRLAALAHYKLVHIHPWVDGNGRTSRLLMNVVLMQVLHHYVM